MMAGDENPPLLIGFIVDDFCRKMRQEFPIQGVPEPELKCKQAVCLFVAWPGKSQYSKYRGWLVISCNMRVCDRETNRCSNRKLEIFGVLRRIDSKV